MRELFWKVQWFETIEAQLTFANSLEPSVRAEAQFIIAQDHFSLCKYGVYYLETPEGYR